MTILYDLVDPAELTGYTRELPVPAEIGLNRYLPDRLIDDIEATINKVTRTNRAAKFRAYDAETPIGKRDTASKVVVELPPIGQKTVIGEYNRLQLARLQGSQTNALVNAIFDDADLNARAVQIRVELARGDVLTDGKFTLTGENGLTLEADFGVPGTHIVNTGISWATHASATVLTDLQTWLDVYEADAGPCGRILVSKTVLRHMMQNAAIRAMASSNGIVPEMISQMQLNQLLELNGLPPVEVYDGRFDVDGVTTRAIPVDKIAFMPVNPSDLGYTAWGITAEALELAEAQRMTLEGAPGLVACVMRTFDPVSTWTKVGGVVMPVLVDPNKLLVADVIL
jgi:hypothetical protein